MSLWGDDFTDGTPSIRNVVNSREDQEMFDIGKYIYVYKMNILSYAKPIPKVI